MSYPTLLPFSADVLEEVSHERGRQIRKHGDQSHLPNGTGDSRPLVRNGSLPTYGTLAAVARATTDGSAQSGGDGSVTYADILVEEVFEALAESDPSALRAELVQVAAVAVQWIETLDRTAASR